MTDILSSNTFAHGFTSDGAVLFNGNVDTYNYVTIHDRALTIFDGVGDFMTVYPSSISSTRSLKISTAIEETLELDSDFTTVKGVLQTASSGLYAGFRLPHRTVPSSLVNGDMWTTTAGLFVRINGVTIGPFVDLTAVNSAVSTHDALTTAHSALQGTLTPVGSSTGAGIVGTATKFSREDHRHQIFVADPVALGAAIGQGVSTSMARADHVHPYPTAAQVGAMSQATADTLYLPIAAATAGSGMTLSGTNLNVIAGNTSLTVSAGDIIVNTAVIAPLASPAFTGTPTAPTQTAFNNSTRLATTAYVDTARASKNWIMNGDFSVNQRALGTSSANDTFGFDRWKLSYQGATSQLSRTFAIGTFPHSPRNYVRVAPTGQTVAGDFAMLTQPIEGVNTLSGMTATVSFWAKASSGTPGVAVELIQDFGVGGSAAVTTFAGKVTINTVWTRYSVTVAVPSITAKTYGSVGDKLTLALWCSAGSTYDARTGTLGLQNFNFEFWGVQMETGPVATTFVQRPYAEELRNCQRYYWQTAAGVTNNVLASGQISSATTAHVQMRYPVPMRVAPTLGTSGSFFVSNRAVNYTVTNLVGSGTSADSMDIAVTASGMTLGQACALYGQSSTPYLTFTAEL